MLNTKNYVAKVVHDLI